MPVGIYGRINRGQQVSFMYHNHRGNQELRQVTFDGLDYIKNDFYPDGALCLTGHDKNRNATRSFDVTKITTFTKVGHR